MSQKNRGRGPGPGPGPHGMMPGAKAKDFKGSVIKLIEYIGKYKWAMLVVFILAVCSTILMLWGPKILGNATDELFTGVMSSIMGSGGVDFGHIAEIMATLITLYVISATLSYIQGFMMSGITAKLTFRMRNDIGSKIHRLPLSFYDNVTHGEILSRITNDVDTISQTLSQNLTQIISSLTSLIGILFMMFSISWQLTLVALCALPITFISISSIMKRSQTQFIGQQKYLGSLNGHIEEMLGTHNVMKAFNGEDASTKIMDGHNKDLYASAWKANFLSSLMMPITIFIGNISYIVVCIMGGYYSVSGVMTIGGIQSFIQYMRQFTQPIAQIANISNVLQQTAAAAERVFEFLDEAEESPDGTDTASLPVSDESVAFNSVSFGYKPDTTIIHNFSTAINPGQKIAIVGPTGAGKTTIVKLLMRFYDVDKGSISIGGNDIRSYRRGELRSIFGMVLQDTWLFNGSIADNIRYGKLNASDEEVRRAAKAAQADHFIRTLPGSYDMIINEEADNISQGQKQLLTIARAILADADILILDEATSSVDTRTEQLIQKAMDHLMLGRTSFIIAHRLSTIRNADLILVMRDGDIVEQGTHDELIGKDSFYAELYNSQFERAV